MKVCERDTDLFLLVADGEKVSAQISQSRAGVNDGDVVRIGDLQARGVAAELLKAGIADGDGSARAIKLELHRIVFMKVSPGSRPSRYKPVGHIRCVRDVVKPSCRETESAEKWRGAPSVKNLRSWQKQTWPPLNRD